MREISDALLAHLTDKFQTLEDNKPNVAVFVRHRFWDLGGHTNEINQEWFQISQRVISVDYDMDAEAFAHQFTISIENDDGDMSPDAYTGQWSDDLLAGGKRVMNQMLLPNTHIKIHAGYGSELIPVVYGLIDEVSVSADNKVLSIKGRTIYKKLIDNTIKPKKGASYTYAPDGNLYTVLKFWFKEAGVELKGDLVYVPGSTEQWTVSKSKGQRLQTYDEVVRDLIDTTFHYIKSNPDGTCELIQIRTDFDQVEEPKAVFDADHNITQLDYNLSDVDVKCTVIVKAGNFQNVFTNETIYRDILLHQIREEEIQVDWADTYYKRVAVAQAIHLQHLHKWKTISVGIPANPALELWDTISVKEKISAQAYRYHIKGIQTTFSDAGFVQVLQLSSNYGYKTSLHSDLSPIQVSVDKIRLVLWDFSVEDGDILNAYINGKPIVKNFEIKNEHKYFDIPLEMGNNTLIFEGVSAGTLATLSAAMEVRDVNNNLLFPKDKLPDLEMARSNLANKKTGVYKIKPIVTWVIARVN